MGQRYWIPHCIDMILGCLEPGNHFIPPEIMLDGDEATPLHFAASRGHSDTVSFISTQNYINAINDRDLFATECMTRYLNKTGSAWCVNRELGNIKFFWLFPKLISYANHYWKVSDKCSLRTFINKSTETSNDMDIVTNDETVVPKSLIEQRGVPLLLNVLYGTKLKMIKYDKDNNFVLHDVKDDGIMVRKNVIIIKKKDLKQLLFESSVS